MLFGSGLLRKRRKRSRAELRELGATKVVTEKELMEQGFTEKVKEWTDGWQGAC